MNESFQWFDCLPEPSVLVTTTGRIVAANTAFAQLTNHSVTEVAGQSLIDFSKGSIPCLIAYLRACSGTTNLLPGGFHLRDGSHWRIEGRVAVPWAPDREAVIFLRFSPKGRAVERFLLLTKNISQLQAEIVSRQRAEEELRALNAELEGRVASRTAELTGANRDLDAFNRTIAHDLRAPLRSIRNFTSIVGSEAEERLSPEENQMLRRVVAASDTMAKMLEDLLAYSQVAAAELPMLHVNLGAALREARETLRDDFERRNAELSVALETERAVANPSLLQHVLQNLFSNAVKFVPADRTPVIKVHARPVGDRIRVDVKDNGVGISPEEQRHLFQLFCRLQNAAKVPGKGLGLAIVARCVEKMGGTFGVDSRCDEGSCFWFNLRAE